MVSVVSARAAIGKARANTAKALRENSFDILPPDWDAAKFQVLFSIVRENARRKGSGHA
jgi:hypothetical protein